MSVDRMTSEAAHSTSKRDVEQYLAFVIADEEYAVGILRVQEIKGWSRVTPLPNTPDYVRGVMNLRGTIVPVIDLRSRFGIEVVDYDSTTVVIVLKVVGGDQKERVVGVVADAVSDVYALAPDQIGPPPRFAESFEMSAVTGLATLDDRLLILLDVDRLLDSIQTPGLAEPSSSETNRTFESSVAVATPHM